MLINVFEITQSKYAVSEKDGKVLYNLIYDQLVVGNNVILDFEDITIASPTFLNNAISQLVKDFSPKLLNSRLSVENITPVIRTVLIECNKNAWRKFKDG